MDWLLIFAIASFLLAFGCLFILGACFVANEADRRHDDLISEMEEEAERVVHRVECPWNIR